MVRQVVHQCIDPLPCRLKALFESVALLGQLRILLQQQFVGTLKLFVAQQQALDTILQLLNQLGVCHSQTL